MLSTKTNEKKRFPVLLRNAPYHRFLIPLLVLFCSAVSAQNNLTLETKQVFPGSSDVNLLVTAEHVEAGGIGGFSFGLDHDEAVLTVTDLRYVGPPLASPGFIIANVEPGFANIGVIFFDTQLNLLPAGTYNVAEATYDVSAAAPVGLSAIPFAAVGTPPLTIEYSTPSGPVTPTTTTGGIQVLATPIVGSIPANQLWVPNSGATTVSVLDVVAPAVIDTPDGMPSSAPNAVAVGFNGVVWTTYSGSDEVIRWDSNTGAPFSPAASAGSIGVGDTPSAVAIDPFGNAWVSNLADHTLTKLSPAGDVLLGTGGLAGAAVAVPGGSLSLQGVGADALGNIWVVSGDGNELHKFNNSGELTLSVPLGAGANPQGIAIDRDGFVWVTLPGVDEVRRYANDGTLADPPYVVTGASPASLAIRGRNTAWVTGPANGMIYRIIPSGMGPSVVTPFPGVTAPDGIAIANNGSIWVSDSTAGSVQQFDEMGAVVGAPVAVGAGPRLVGDASGYLHANILLPLEDFDGDGIENRSETDGGSNPFDAASVPAAAPVEDLVCLAMFTGVATDWLVTLSWMIPTGATYTSIEILRNGVSQGFTVLPTDTSFMQVVTVTDDYTYTVRVSTVAATADTECGVAVGPGNFVDSHPVGVGDQATNLVDITYNPAPLTGEPTFYVTEAGTNQIIGLDADYTETSSIPSPFPPGMPLTGIAYFPCSTCGSGGALWVATGSSTSQATVQELELDGTPIGLPRPLRSGGQPIFQRIGAMAGREDINDPGSGVLFASGPASCELFGFKTNSPMFDAQLSLSAIHPNAGAGSYGLSAITFPSAGDFGSGDGGNILLMGQDPCEVSFEVVEYDLEPGAGPGGMALLTPVGTPIPLDGVAGESVFGGIAATGGEIAVTGVATSVVYELDVRRLFLRGDANGTGAIDIADAVAILNALFAGGMITDPNCPEESDVNGDGTVNVADPVYLLVHLFSMGPPPPAPFPDPGLDLTENGLDCVE